MDITEFMAEFLDLIIDMLTKTYNWLDSITFAGISLLQFIITINVLGAVVILLFTLVSGYSVSTAHSYSIKERRKAERRKEK